jgi:hypothetical protein
MPVDRWAQDKPFDSADYLEGDAPTYPAAEADEGSWIVKPIPTKRLRSADIPRIDPAAIDYERPVTPQLHDLWTFALTFDGYRYFGVTDGFGRLGDFAASVEQEHRRTGRVPRLGEIGMYRGCLFFEQRMWCKWDKSDGDPSREDVIYLRDLAEAIRSRVS